ISFSRHAGASVAGRDSAVRSRVWPSNHGQDWRTSCCFRRQRRRPVQVDDLDISPSKIGETAQRIVDRATEEARRREHALLTNEHVFLAFAQVEWDMFAEVMRDVELNPHTILQAIEEHLHMMPSFAGRDLRVPPA